MKASQPAQLQTKVAAAVFHHLRKGGGETQDIASYAELAGNQAYSLTAYSEAQYYYLQALLAIVGNKVAENAGVSLLVQHVVTSLTAQYSAPLSEVFSLCRLLELIAECSFILGCFEEARTLYETLLVLRTSSVFKEYIATLDEDEAIRSHQEAQIQALIWREIVSTWKATGAYDKAHEGCHRGKEVLRQADETTCAAWACLHLVTGDILRYEGNYQEARRYSQEALGMLEHLVQTIPEHSTSFLPQRHGDKQMTGKQYTVAHRLTRTEKALRGDATDLANAYEQLGVIEASVGHANEAQRYMHLALTEYEQQERISEVVRVCGNLGAVFTMKSEHAQARQFLNRALDLAERSGDLPNIAFITSNLGDVAHHSGDLVEAEGWYNRSLTLAERINDREHVSWCSVLLAHIQQDLGNLREATINLYRAIRVGRAIRNSRCIRFALVGLGDLRTVEVLIACKLQPTEHTVHAQSPSVACQRLLRRAKSTLQRAISQEDVEMETVIECKLLLAFVYLLHNDLVTAQQIAMQTLEQAQTQETIRVIGRAQRLLGRILSEQENYCDADIYFEQALAIFQKQELRLDYARTLHGYGLSLVKRGLVGEETHSILHEQAHLSYQRGMSFLYEAREMFRTAHAAIDFSWVDLVISNYTSTETESAV